MDSAELNFILKIRDEASAVIKSHAGAIRELGAAHGDLKSHAKEAETGLASLVNKAKEAAEAVSAIWAASEVYEKTIGAFGELEVSLVRLRQSTNETKANMIELQEGIEKIAGNSLNQTNEQIAAVAVSASQLGVKGVEGILAFTTTVSQMATISGQSAGSVAAATAKIIGSTGEGEEGVAKFGAAFAALQAHTRGGGAALLQTAQQISMSTQQYEISGVKILGVAAALDNLGGRARSGGMAFTQTLSVMTKAVEENSYKLQDLARSTGMTADEFKSMLSTDPTSVFVKMLEAVNRLQKGGGDVHAFLKEFGLDNNLLSSTILAAAKNIDKFKDSISSAENADPGKLGKDAEEMFSTVEGSIHAASQAAKNFGEALGMAIAPAFVQTMGVATQVVKALGEAFHDLPAGGQAAVAGLAVIIPVIIAIRTAYRFLMEVVESGIGQYRNMSGIMGVVTKSAQFLRAAEEEVAVAHGHAATAATAHGEAELKAADAVSVHTAALVKEGGAALTTAAEMGTFTASVEMANVALVSNARALGVGAVEMELFGAKSTALGPATAAAVASQSGVFTKIGVGIGRLMGFGIGFSIGSAIGDFVGHAVADILNNYAPKVANAIANWRETSVLGNGIKWAGNEMGLKTPAQKDEEAAHEKKAHDKIGGEVDEHTPAATGKSSEHLDAVVAERAAYDGLISSGRELIKSYDAVTEKTQKLGVAQRELTALEQVPENQRPAEMDDKHLAALQMALDIVRENLDPMNKVMISLREQVASSEAVTKAKQNELEITNKLRELSSSDPNFDKSKADAFTGLMQVKQQNDIKKAFDDQIKVTRESIQMSGALTASEKSRLEIELKIADAQKNLGYSPDQIASLKQALSLEQQIKDSVAQMDALNPQAKAIRDYAEQNKTLQGRLDRGEITPGEKNREQTKLDADTLGARDPIGKIVDDQKTELAQLKVIGEYKEAELKTMGQIDALTKSGLTVTKDTENALREYNKAVQDQKQAQSSGFEGWANKVGDMKSKLQDLESSFADGLSTAITGALSGKKGNFSALAQNIGGQMIKLGVDQVLKQGIQASGIGNLFGLGSGEAAAKAKAASDALAAAGAKQVAGAGANADAMAKQLTTASMAVTATTVNINGAVAGAAPGMPGGNQAGLPGTGGASLPSGAGTSTPQQVDIASVGGTALTTPTIPFSAPGQIAAGTAAMGTVGAGAGFGIGTLGNPGEGGLGRGSINWGTSGGQGPAMKGLGEAGIPYLGGNISSKKAFELNPPPANLNLPATPAVAQKAFEQQGLGNPFKSGVAGMGQNPGMGGFGVEAFGKLPSSGGASNAAQLIARKEAFLGTARMDVNAQRLGYGSDTITDQTGSIRRVKAGDTVSKDDAMLDLQRRSAISEATAKKQIGADTFNKFDPNTRAALTSNAYNYGSLKPGLTSAAQTGDKEKIAAALEAQSAQAARGGPGQKGNIARRQEEADIVRGNKDLNGRPIDKNAQRGGFDGHPTPPANIPQVDNVHIDQAKKQAEVGNKAMLDVQKQGHNQQIDAAHKAQTDSLQAQTRAGMQSTQAVRQSAQQQVQTVQASGQQTTAAFQQAGTGIQTAGTDAQTAGPEFQQAGQQIQQAGQQAQSGGGDMGGFGQSIAGLAGPLSQGKQGMGSFAQAALGMVSKMLSGMGGGGGGGGIGGMLGGLFGGMHSGGLVGSSSMYSTSHFVSPAVFANAQRFHSGLMNDEYPAILQRGERVLTANDNSRNTALLAGMSDHMQQMQRGSAASQGGNGGPRSQSMHMTINTPDASSFRKSQPQIMSEAHSKMQRAGSKSA